MKKIAIITIAMMTCFWCGVFFTNIIKRDVRTKERDYIFMGKEKSASSVYSDSLRDLYDTPLGLYNKANDIISSPEMAYAIADCILSNIYGHSAMDNERVYVDSCG